MLNPNYVIYLLINTINNYTYIGITNNTDRRLRQHNGELVGGAKYTTAKRGEGTWSFYGWIKSKIGLDKSRAMSIEKKIQIHSRKFKGNPIEKRLQSVNKSLLENPDLEFEIFHKDS